MHLILAFRAFFSVLFNRQLAQRVRNCLDNKSPSAIELSPSDSGAKLEKASIPSPQQPKPASQSKPRSGDRNGALTLLSALQRESRLLDLVCESLDSYSDAQIGAAARDVLRDSRKVLDRMFGLKHLVDTPEGETIELPEIVSPIRWRVIGNDSSKSGSLCHPGWQATKLDLPQWAGNADDSMVIAAAEVEA
jgi:hypothetical protein